MASTASGDDLSQFLSPEALSAQPELAMRLLQLLGLSYDAIFFRDADSIITYWNAGAEWLYGWRAEEARGRRSHDLLQTEFPPLPLPIDALLIQEGQWQGELLHRLRDGTRVAVESRQVVLRGSDGRPLAILETNRDISQRKQSELLQQQLAAIVESTDDAIIGKTLDAIITSWNRGAERLYGYSAEEMIGKSVALLVPPDHPDELASIMARLRRGERIDQYGTERIAKDGRRLHVALTVSPIRDATGRIVGASAIARDITERVRIRQALEESEERLRLAARAAGFGTYDDRGPGQVHWSDEMKAIFGLPAGEKPQEGVRVALDLIHPDDREGWLAALRAAHDPAGPGIMDVEHRIVRPDGRTVWVAQKGRVLFEGEGANRRGVRAIGLVADITPRVEAELALRETAAARDRALAEARDALRLRDEFLSAISHDLRAPLTAVQGLLQIARRRLQRVGTAVGDQLAANLADAERATKSMNAMLDELLDLSRLDSGRPLDLDRQPLDLVALAQRLVMEHQHAAAACTLRLEALVPALEGDWDAVRLERVLEDLLSNAVKYSPDGGAITVTVGCECAVAGGDASAVVTVQDEGIGIPAADLPHIFERFQRGSNVPRRIRGTGIGLAGARQIVEQHGGTLTAESEEGHGSRFTVRLPLHLPPP